MSGFDSMALRWEKTMKCVSKDWRRNRSSLGELFFLRHRNSWKWINQCSLLWNRPRGHHWRTGSKVSIADKKNPRAELFVTHSFLYHHPLLTAVHAKAANQGITTQLTRANSRVVFRAPRSGQKNIKLGGRDVDRSSVGPSYLAPESLRATDNTWYARPDVGFKLLCWHGRKDDGHVTYLHSFPFASTVPSPFLYPQRTARRDPRSSVDHRMEIGGPQHLHQLLTVESAEGRPENLSGQNSRMVVMDVPLVMSHGGSRSSKLSATPFRVEKIIVASKMQEKERV